VAGDPRGWLEREADRLAALAAPAVAADPVAPFSLEEFEGHVRGLQAFLRTRPAYVACAAGAQLDPSAAGACPLPATDTPSEPLRGR
jgi:hypothetical protein